MYAASSDSMVKDTLKNLSCDNGWSYGVFWRFDQRNSSLLTLQGAYYEEHMGVLVDDMILQVHSLGEGVIGEVSLTKRHKWMMADAHSGTSNAEESVEGSDIFQDHQFSIGIKTIAVISVEPLGVVQFGSTEKVSETLKFVNQTKELFHGIEIIEGLIFPESEQSSSTIDDTRGTSDLFTTLLSGMNPHCASPNLQSGDSCNYFVEMNCSTANLSRSFPSTSAFENMNATVTASSLCGNHFRVANTESQGYSDGSVSDILLQQSEMELSAFFGSTSSQGPCSNPWRLGDIEESPKLNSSCSNGLFADAVKTSMNCSDDIIISQNFGSSFHPGTGRVQSINTLDTFDELLGKDNSSNALPKYCAMEDVSQWFAPATDQSRGMVATALTNDLSNASGIFSLSPSSKGYHTPTKILSDNQSSASVQSSITNSFDFSERKKYVDMFGSGKLLEGPGMDLGATNCQYEESILTQGVSSGNLSFNASGSQCISELYANRRIGKGSTLFSKLGLYQHFDDIAGDTFSIARSDCDDDHLSSTAKRRKVERSLMSSNKVKCVPDFARNTNPVSSIYSLNKEKHIESVSEITRTFGARSCFGDSSSVVDGHTTSYPEPLKMKKKRAKPGTKQKSKDRIQIAARLADLRELIPNGEKMSIDRLLHQTIKHLVFLQSVTKHAEDSQQSDKQKFQQNDLVQKEKGSSCNGATWACEVGNETMFCPLIVEDLSVPGQMLIEMICEEQGFFLEIVDIIRGFGLTILKGIMEVRETKLWAQFTVGSEEKQQITRHEIFSSLVQLLQFTCSTEMSKSAELFSPMGGEAGLFNNCQQSCLPLPVTLTNKSL